MFKKALLIVPAALILAGCSTSTTPVASPEATATPQAQVQNTPEATPMATLTPAQLAKAKKFTVKGLNFSFDVKEIKVKQGDVVTINFANTEGTHNWVLDEFNARTETIPEGQTSSVTFVADKTGTFEYYCSVGKHRQLGMVGNLIVQ
ncbi:MAG TPA: plastocyanin/azurin family copper-binding protein [Patescibacteria group bacterium]|nr:plastocyanin/azurin family copper-binding protein [Patescibacteria group bacterium]